MQLIILAKLIDIAEYLLLELVVNWVHTQIMQSSNIRYLQQL